jgi:predicted enzyme related to lactoylglutathione lyase
MPVLGVGGFFFRANDPETLAAWYREHLGVGAAEGEWTWAAQGGPLVFAPFPAGTDYWAGDKQVLLNLRVSDLAGLLDELRAAGVDVITRDEWDDPQTGSFARVHDPEGNPVELWEPPAR